MLRNANQSSKNKGNNAGFLILATSDLTATIPTLSRPTKEGQRQRTIADH
ncbi:MAG: hypothetical protein AAGA02_01010 [Bacteroidota bacterium]